MNIWYHCNWSNVVVGGDGGGDGSGDDDGTSFVTV